MLLAEVLRRMASDFGADVAVVYLATQDDDGTYLTVLAVGGAPPAVFTVPEVVSCDCPLATAAAYRTGRAAASDGASVICREERMLQLTPYPYSVVAVPLIAGDEKLGVLTGIWIPPSQPSESGRLQDQVTTLAQPLAAALANRDRGTLPTRPIRSPSIIPYFESQGGGEGTVTPEMKRRWGLPSIPGSSALSQMYQVHRLSADLNRASGVADVMRAAHERIMVPFGAETFIAAVANEGRFRVVGYNGPAEMVQRLHNAPLDQNTPITDVLATGNPLFFPDREAMLAAYPDAEGAGIQACAVLPLVGSGNFRGIFLLGFKTARRIEAQEQTILLMMAAQLTVTMERCQLNEAEHALAEALQKRLLPRSLPELPEVVITARYLSTSSPSGIGGDWYDVIPLSGGRTGLVIGDVEGHSIDSTVIMGQLRSGLRAYAAEGHEPADVLSRSSELLAELDTDLFATCCFARLDPEGGVLEIALAGHPVPLLRCPEAGIVEVDAPTNLPLGVEPGYVYRSTEVTIRPETLLMLYTDGIVHSDTGDPVSDAHELLASAHDIESRSLHKVADFIATSSSKNPARRQDDMALLFALYEGNPLGSIRRVDRMALQRHDIQGVQSSRRFVRRYLLRRDLERLTDDFEVMTSEIVTNALIHADSDVEIWLREYPDRIHFEARDTGVKPPVPTSITDSDEFNAEAEHGRGLSIVNILSSAWGTSPHGRGKTVWFDVPK
ncbi:SpoIIE family protein phosphatase [Streptomyces sp. NPDC005065]|uniref:SpoIIE family protein phosphatase n=1 Tax=Streptomyces sp. NPDC005065 TaxID=3154461 RepID=UPI0033B4719D